ncbi:hypothetical protein ACHAXM_004999 [Skeletonema potamos]
MSRTQPKAMIDYLNIGSLSTIRPQETLITTMN